MKQEQADKHKRMLKEKRELKRTHSQRAAENGNNEHLDGEGSHVSKQAEDKSGEKSEKNTEKKESRGRGRAQSSTKKE